MESLQEIKQLITDAKNICVIPSQTNEPESLSAALALFYTLKEIQKNVNLIIQELPENLGFLTPSIEYISQPKNFVISIPKHAAEISQVYYEKNDESLKIHLTINKGTIKKDTVSFYFSDAKPDLVITLGIQNFQKELEGKLNSFGFLLDTPIVNIDNNLENLKFGKVNAIEQKSLTEMVLEITKSVSQDVTPKNAAQCFLTGLTLHYENFKNPMIRPEIFELFAQLMKQGADRGQIMENLYHKQETDAPVAPTSIYSDEIITS